MKFVTCMNGVFRISERGFRHLLQDRSAGGDIDLNKYGAVFIANVRLDVTDMSPLEATHELQAMAYAKAQQTRKPK